MYKSNNKNKYNKKCKAKISIKKDKIGRLAMKYIKISRIYIKI